MKTPIVDFLNGYVKSTPSRLHMPGHKGKLGYERDITEIDGADSLYHANGIIRESERYTSELFCADTFFSTEGSSLSIRAMLYLVSLYAKESGKKNKILAARNAHRSFFSAAALLDTELDFFGFENDYLSSVVTPEDLERTLDSQKEPPAAVYLTSPDYLGKMQDIREISKVCHKRDILLIVDNAHGAYLAFIEESLHPIALGADMSADSAHKTLPALTGAGYLHVSKNAPKYLTESVKAAMALFGSTSPSYLILESLDRLNGIINDDFRAKLRHTATLVSEVKQKLISLGYKIISDEPLKISVDTREYGYSGYELANVLKNNNIYPEFYDRDHLVMMFSTENTDDEIQTLFSVFSAVAKRPNLSSMPPSIVRPTCAMSVREATLSPKETVRVDDSIGRILADASVSCPPAVPILVPGEVVNESAIEAFKYYGYNEISVIK